MQLKPAQLAQHLSQSLASSYLISGDEPLIVQECSDAIRRAAREAGCMERQCITINHKDDEMRKILIKIRAVDSYLRNITQGQCLRSQKTKARASQTSLKVHSRK